MSSKNFRLEFHPEGDKSLELAEELKTFTEDLFRDISSTEIYKVKNLGFGESILVVAIGQVVGQILRTIIDKILEKKKSSENQEIVVTLKFIPSGRQFQLPDDVTQVRKFLEDNET